jgi:hypothetical protein
MLYISVTLLVRWGFCNEVPGAVIYTHKQPQPPERPTVKTPTSVLPWLVRFTWLKVLRCQSAVPPPLSKPTRDSLSCAA